MEDYSLFWQLAHALLHWEGSLKKQLGNGDKISYVGAHALYSTDQRGAYLDVKDRRSTSRPAQPNSVNKCFVKWPTVFQVLPFFSCLFSSCISQVRMLCYSLFSGSTCASACVPQEGTIHSSCFSIKAR